MILSDNQGLNIHKVIKTLLTNIGQTATLNIGLTNTYNDEKYKDHFFKCPNDYTLEYWTNDNEGQEMRFTYRIIKRSSNLPGKEESVRYYLYKKGKTVQKLHLHSFLNGVFYCFRHDYKHIYRTQCKSERDRSFFYHDFEAKKDRLINSKKKLRLRYKGKPTKTAERLFHYQERINHYEEQSVYYTKKMLDRFGYSDY